MPTSMSRYQWLLVALLSANFGVVFFERKRALTADFSCSPSWEPRRRRCIIRTFT
jgi:hypothetical protein